MVQYYVGEFGLDIRAAALLAACFSLPGGVLRAVGGWLSDKVRRARVTWWVLWVSWICLFLLSYPQTDMTILTTTSGPKTFHIGLNVWLFTHPDVRARHRMGVRQGVGVQVHLRRLSRKHRCHLGRRRPGRRHGRIRAASHVRSADGPHRHPFERLHADVRRGLGIADMDVLDGSARRRTHGEQGQAVPPSGTAASPSNKGHHEHHGRNAQARHRGATRARERRHRRLAPRGQRVLGAAPARRSPTATCGSRCPPCCAASRSGECGESSRSRC